MCTEDDKSSVEEVFRRFDADGNGFIDQGELQTLLQEIEPEFWTSERVDELFSEVDRNPDGLINVHEFIEWVWSGDAPPEVADLVGQPRDLGEPIICGGPMICGGFGEKRPADDEAQAVADQVKDAAVEKANILLMEGAEWKVTQYSSQVVAGTNYDIDVNTGNSGCVNIQVFVDLEGNAELTNATYMARQTCEIIDAPEPLIEICPEPELEVAVEPMVCGGFGQKQPADAEVQALADKLKDAAVERANMLLMEDAEWKAVQYSCQVVAGTNYDIDVDTGNSGRVNITVYVDLEGNAELTSATCITSETCELAEPQMIICSAPEPEICPAPIEPMCGGFGGKQPADAKVQAIADKVKDAALEKANMALMEGAEWKAVQYSSQVVAGTNYDIDVDTGNSGFVNIKVYVDLEENSELTHAVYMETLDLAVPL